MEKEAPKKVDLRALVWFILLTFVPTLALTWFSFSRGQTFSSGANFSAGGAVGLSMFFPGLAAFIVRKFITREGFVGAGLKLGPRKMYLWTYMLIFAAYALIYALTWIFAASPDLSLLSFSREYGLPPPPQPGFILLILTFSTFVAAPIFNLIPTFGEEFGWRGLLLEKLLPLGERKATLISGMIWALWHTPFILLLGFGYSKDRLWGALLFFAIVTCLGVWLGYLRFRSGSVFLPTFAHAVFNAHAYGIWTIIFPVADPVWAGKISLLALPFYFAIGLWSWFKLAKPAAVRGETPPAGSPGSLAEVS
jgi:membrane protease YdiL (CAAX protease family)